MSQNKIDNDERYLCPYIYVMDLYLAIIYNRLTRVDDTISAIHQQKYANILSQVDFGQELKVFIKSFLL